MIETKDLINMLNADADRFDTEAQYQKDRIIGAYFTGKAESHRLTINDGRCSYPGQYWQDQDNANELFCEELARVKSEYKEQN